MLFDSKTLKMLVSLHDHTYNSDGEISWQEYVYRAFNQGFFMVGPADHHHVETKALTKKLGFKLKDLWKPVLELDYYAFCDAFGYEKIGENRKMHYVNCFEFTVRDDKVLNLKGRPAKYHILCVAPMLDNPHSKTRRLLQLKRINDIDAVYARIEYLFRIKGLEKEFPKQEVAEFMQQQKARGFNMETFNEDATWEFFRQYPYLRNKVVDSNKEFKRKMKWIKSNIQRLDVPLDVLLEAIHEDKGLAFVAHPARNFRRLSNADVILAIQSMIERGIDGFCINEVVEKYVKPHDDESEKDDDDKQCTLSTGDINKLITLISRLSDRADEIILAVGGYDRHTREQYDRKLDERFTVATCLEIINRLLDTPAMRNADTIVNIEQMNEKIRKINERKPKYAQIQPFTSEIDFVCRFNKRTGNFDVKAVERKLEKDDKAIPENPEQVDASTFIDQNAYYSQNGKPCSKEYKIFERKVLLDLQRSATMRVIRDLLHENGEVRQIVLEDGTVVTREWIDLVRKSDLTLEQYEAMCRGDQPEQKPEVDKFGRPKDNMVSRDAVASHDGGRPGR